MVREGFGQFSWAPVCGGMTWVVPPGSVVSCSGVRVKALVVADAVGGIWGCGKAAPRLSVLHCF